jgi:hypothetical protein
MVNVSIIIVNYNTKLLTSDCIDSIYKHTTSITFEIIVVDNCSTDNSVLFLSERFNKIKILQSNKNRGFGLANNLGVSHAMGEFIFLLNSDTLLIENSIKDLFDFFILNEKKLNIGVLGALLIDEIGNINGYGGSFTNSFKEIKNRIFGSTSVNYDNILEKGNQNYFLTDYVIGADMFMRRDLFVYLNGFSSDFFMYFEESDLQKRVVNLGFLNYIFLKTRIIHLEDGTGKSLHKYHNSKRIIVHQSKIHFLKRNDSHNFIFFKIFDMLILILQIFNFKYSFKENMLYISNILREY